MHLYDGTTSRAKTYDSITDCFSITVGVRQGDVLSPFLYALFLDPVVKKVNALGLGVGVGLTSRLSMLLYADDMSLIARSETELQLMLTAVQEFAQENGFELNVGKTKSQVFFPRRGESCNLLLYGSPVECVQEFRYLGIIFKSNLCRKVSKTDLLHRALRALRRTIPPDPDLDFLSITSLELVYKAKVRSVVEYCMSIIGGDIWTTAEQLQVEAARRILRLLGTKTSNDAILGDLGWVSLRARRDELRLRFWCRLVGMEDDRLAKQVYLASRANLQLFPQLRCWVSITRNILAHYQLQHLWIHDLPNRTECVETVFSAEENSWRARLQTKSKLQWYSHNKNKLAREPYMDLVKNGHHRRLLLRLRASNFMIRIEYGRIDGLPRPERMCLMCCNGAVEDEQHFLTECSAFGELRHTANLPHVDFSDPQLAVSKLLCVPQSYRDDWQTNLQGSIKTNREEFLRECFVSACTFLQELARQRETLRFLEKPYSPYCSKTA